jgi:putative SOS response-associated peptidase YedK
MGTTRVDISGDSRIRSLAIGTPQQTSFGGSREWAECEIDRFRHEFAATRKELRAGCSRAYYFGDSPRRRRMCGRTSLFIPQWILEERFDATAIESIEPRYNIAPETGRLAVITNTQPGDIRQFEWGLVPFWADDPQADGPRPINARAEKVASNNLYRKAFERRRCLVLADGFYEWGGKPGAKQPYRITRQDNQPFAMAGLWERWEPEDGEATPVQSTTIITTEPNEMMAAIHDRMPVVLERAEEEQWLRDAGADAHRDLLAPARESLLRKYPISKAVNNPGNDSPDVVRRIDVPGQARLGDFGA